MEYDTRSLAERLGLPATLPVLVDPSVHTALKFLNNPIDYSGRGVPVASPPGAIDYGVSLYTTPSYAVSTLPTSLYSEPYTVRASGVPVAPPLAPETRMVPESKIQEMMRSLVEIDRVQNGEIEDLRAENGELRRRLDRAEALAVQAITTTNEARSTADGLAHTTGSVVSRLEQVELAMAVWSTDFLSQDDLADLQTQIEQLQRDRHIHLKKEWPQYPADPNFDSLLN